MTETSAILNLPYIQAAQAQKHVTHNEALRILDILVQAVVDTHSQSTPPQDPIEGARAIVGPSPTGVWSDGENAIALWSDNTWHLYPPQAGWRVYTRETGEVLQFDGRSWRHAQATRLGVNATPDAHNRLAVASDAALLTHNGAGHQLVINKASTSDTASLLFQSNWQGRAEMGCSGSDAFSIKVTDGAEWRTALAFDSATGLASGAAIQASPTDLAPGLLARTDYTYGRGNLIGQVSSDAGLPTGGVIESGKTAQGRYVRWADGTQICTVESGDLTADGSEGALFVSAAETLAFPVSFATSPQVSCGYSAVSGSGWASMDIGADSTQSVVRVYSATSGSIGRAMLTAIGTWQ